MTGKQKPQEEDQQMNDFDSFVESPCIDDCCLNDDDICLGCFRSREEIMKWREISNHERIAILKNAQQRREAKLGGQDDEHN